MAVYVFLYIGIFIIFAFQKSTFHMFKDNKKNLLLMFFLVLILVGLRNPAMGNDLPGYIISFELCKELSLVEMIALRSDIYEIGFIVFIKLLSFFTESEVVFLFVCTLVSLSPVVYVLIKNNVDSFYATITYIALPSFLMLYSGLRQSIAYALCFFSLIFLKDNKLIKFFITIGIAMLFHSSAFIFILSLPAYKINIKRKHRIYTLFLLGVVFLIREPLFLILSPIFGQDYVFINSSNSFGVLMFLLLNYILAIFFTDENDKEANGYINILYLGILCQVFASVNHMVMRISEYFIFSLILIVPKIVFRMRKNKFNSIVLSVGYCVMLVFMGLLFIYQGGSSWAESYPYYWFWQDYLG